MSSEEKSSGLLTSACLTDITQRSIAGDKDLNTQEVTVERSVMRLEKSNIDHKNTDSNNINKISKVPNV